MRSLGKAKHLPVGQEPSSTVASIPPQQLRDLLGNGQATGQPRGFDAEELHETGHAMLAGPQDAKVGRGLAGTADLGAYACVAGLQRVVGGLSERLGGIL